MCGVQLVFFFFIKLSPLLPRSVCFRFMPDMRWFQLPSSYMISDAAICFRWYSKTAPTPFRLLEVAGRKKQKQKQKKYVCVLFMFMLSHLHDRRKAKTAKKKKIIIIVLLFVTFAVLMPSFGLVYASFRIK